MYVCGMRLIYIYHSGFVIEAEGFSILIDFYKDTGVAAHRGYVHDELSRRPGPIYILSSHFHPDHFNPEILRWGSYKEDIKYIFSRDILRHRRAKAEDAIYLMKGEQYKDENLTIQAFGSTDIGISFLIEAEGKKIFHAGDLNNWHWKEESTAQEIATMEKDYLNEVNLLAKTTERVDLAMFPVDPRLGSDYMLGAVQFIERIKTGTFAPMHFGEAYRKANAFKKIAEEHNVRFMEITHKGQSIDI